MDNSSIRGFFNEWYVRDISKKIRATFECKRKQGKFYKCAPYGYMKDPNDNNHLIPDPATRDNVLSIFESYAAGKSLRAIAEELNAKQIPSPIAYKTAIYPNYRNRYTDNVWTSGGLRGILRNEAYIGNCVLGKSCVASYRSRRKSSVPKEQWVRVEHTHEAIIPMELWEKAHSRRKSPARASRGTQEVQQLSGKVICGVCGRPMSRCVNKYYRKSTDENVAVSFYRCPNTTNGSGLCNNARCINFKCLQRETIDAINAEIATYCNAGKINVNENFQDTLTRLQGQRQQIQSKIDVIRRRIDKLYTDKLDGLITVSEYSRFKSQFSDDIAALETQLDDVLQKIEHCENFKRDSEYRDAIIGKYTSVTELTRQIADEFIDTIVVGAVDENGGRKIDVILKI